MDIYGKVVVVTGASAGIGLATARLFARHGAKVALAARSADTLAEIARELPDSLSAPVDMRDPDAVRRMVEAVRDHYGRIDVLVNNAGQAQYAPVERADLEQYRQIVELNVFGPLAAMQSVIPIMRAQGGGVIVNISSMVTRRTIPNLATYASTKHALNALSLTARVELAVDNIRVGLVYPGLVATGFGRNAFGTPRADMPSGIPPELIAPRILDAVESERAETFVDDEPPRS